MGHKRILTFFIASSVVVILRGQLTDFDNENELHMNFTNLWDLLKPQSNSFLHELNGHWSFNDTIDISKYEDFDHTKFENSRELSLDELLDKVKDKSRDEERSTPPPEDLPSFDTNLITNSSVQLGVTAFLHCRVRNLNNRAVSWVRRRDWHILTSATFTYTNDERFQVIHSEGSDDWTLQIKYVQKRDSGAYECQVATGRGTLSHYFNLEVVVPTAYILGTGEYHIGQGSTISLVCIIENSPTPPQYVMWFHNDKLINTEAPLSDSQVQVVTETGAGDKTHSRLLITEATHSHTGNYTCGATNTDPDSVYVFVASDGDNIAAIQRQDASTGTSPCLTLLILLLVAISIAHW